MRLPGLVFLGIAALGTYYVLTTDNSRIKRIRETARETVPRSWDRSVGTVKDSIEDTYITYRRKELEDLVRSYEQKMRNKR